jgi:hypothetical protein
MGRAATLAEQCVIAYLTALRDKKGSGNG